MTEDLHDLTALVMFAGVIVGGTHLMGTSIADLLQHQDQRGLIQMPQSQYLKDMFTLALGYISMRLSADVITGNYPGSAPYLKE
ncbi:MAG: hypothetical protein Q7K45_05185 [Nanoarchaeota archaeon]|nr:hypothetical protein [Nanoarchaeota archaeon]